MKNNEVCFLSPNFKPTSKQKYKSRKKKCFIFIKTKKKNKKTFTSNVITTCKREMKGWWKCESKMKEKKGGKEGGGER
jgi:hypothetical protein